MLVEQFKRWACGYSGMDGGNPFGDLWFCGIEFGGESQEKDFAKLKDEIAAFRAESNPPDVEPSIRSSKDFNCQLNHKIAKIACRYYRNGQDPVSFLHDELCDAGSESGVFKMNLYPINFRSADPTQWSEHHRMITGFCDKLQYKAWCIRNRFPALNELVKRYSPRVLICFGLNHYLDYLLAFDEAIDARLEEIALEHEPKKVANYTWINGGKTLFMISPFLGQGGLMSDVSLFTLADFARTTTQPKAPPSALK